MSQNKKRASRAHRAKEAQTEYLYCKTYNYCLQQLSNAAGLSGEDIEDIAQIIATKAALDGWDVNKLQAFARYCIPRMVTKFQLGEGVTDHTCKLLIRYKEVNGDALTDMELKKAMNIEGPTVALLRQFSHHQHVDHDVDEFSGEALEDDLTQGEDLIGAEDEVVSGKRVNVGPAWLEKVTEALRAGVPIHLIAKHQQIGVRRLRQLLADAGLAPQGV